MCVRVCGGKGRCSSFYDGWRRSLALGRADGELELWDGHAPSLGLIKIVSFPGHRLGINCVALSHNCKFMASGGVGSHMKARTARIVCIVHYL